MGAACQSCSGMGVLYNEDGTVKGDCPECVGGKKVDREPALVTAPTVLPASKVEELPPSTATPSGNTVAAVTDQGGFAPVEAERVPAAVKVTEDARPFGAPAERYEVSLEEVPVALGGTAPTPEAAAAESEAIDEGKSSKKKG